MTAALILPPVAPYFRSVELGFVQLAGQLRADGWQVDAIDANRDWFAWRAAAGEVAAETFFHGDEPGVAEQLAHAARLRAEQLLPPCWWVSEVMAWLDRGADAWEPWLEAELADRLAGVKHIGLSAMSASQAAVALCWARWLRRREHAASIVLGGAWATTARDLLPAWSELLADLDAVCTFEAERAYGGFLATGGGPLISGEAVPLAELAPPAFDLVDPRRYPRPRLALLSRRRCHWSGCRFCAHVFHADPRPRDALPAASVAARLDSYQQAYGVSEFELADLATPAAALEEITRAVAARELGCSLSALVRADQPISAERARRLAAGGLRTVCVGLESCREDELRRHGKGIALGSFEAAVGALHDAGIEVGAFVMHLPGQREEELAQTLHYLRGLRSVDVAICQRFQLSRNAAVFRHPGSLPLRPLQRVDRWLDVHRLPCRQDGMCTLERYEQVVREAAGELQLALVDPLF